METKNPPKFVRWAVLVSIVALITIFSWIAVSFFFPEPKYDDFCDMQPQEPVTTQEECVAQGGEWQFDRFVEPETGKVSGWCDLQHECRAAYEAADTEHTYTVFLILLGIGALAVLAGIFIKGSSIVAAGLSYGGLVIIITTGIRYLTELNQLVQLLAVFAALIVVLIVAYRKFKD